MSDLSKVLKTIRPAVQVGLQARTAYLTADRAARDREKVEAALKQKQQGEDEMRQAQFAHLRAQTGAILNPKPPAPPAPQRVYDPKRGGVVDELSASFFPIPNLPSLPDEPPPPRNIDPLSDEGIAAAAQRAAAVGKAEQPFRTPSQEPLVQVQQADGSVVYVPRGQAVGQQAPGRVAGGSADKAKRVQALANVSDALDSFERTLTTIGSTIMPGVDKSALGTDYENLQLQLKELYNLGVLNGPDLELMRRIINDPTDLKGRVMALGSGEEQTKRTLAQVQQVRAKLRGFQDNLAAGNSAIGGSAPGTPPARPAAPASGAGGRGGAPPATRPAAAPTREQALWDAAVAKHGREKVTQMYGPRPGGG